jgi:hypothetical protein
MRSGAIPASSRRSANPADLWLLPRHGRWYGLRMADDDRRDRHPRCREAERGLALRRVQEALGKADPAGAKSEPVGCEHQVIGSQRAVFDDPRALGDPGDQDQAVPGEHLAIDWGSEGRGTTSGSSSERNRPRGTYIIELGQRAATGRTGRRADREDHSLGRLLRWRPPGAGVTQLAECLLPNYPALSAVAARVERRAQRVQLSTLQMESPLGRARC